MNETLCRGFGYERWANELWCQSLEDHESGLPDRMVRFGRSVPGGWPDFPLEPPMERVGQIFAHILWAQEIWIRRCGVEVAEVQEGALHQVERLCAIWIDALERIPETSVIEYRNFSGQPHARPFGEIAHHVLNHGTYHRGQMREAFERAGGLSPATDLILYTDSAR